MYFCAIRHQMLIQDELRYFTTGYTKSAGVFCKKYVSGERFRKCNFLFIILFIYNLFLLINTCFFGKIVLPIDYALKLIKRLKARGIRKIVVHYSKHLNSLFVFCANFAIFLSFVRISSKHSIMLICLPKSFSVCRL